jgi:hypothetical protein
MMWNKLAVKRAKDFVIEESQKSTCFRHEFSSYPMI